MASLTRADLEQLVERRVRQVDVKGDVMAERMRTNLRRRHSTARMRVITGVVVVLIGAWIIIRLVMAQDLLHAPLTSWWNTHSPPGRLLTMNDVILELEFPTFRWLISHAFASREISAAGAGFLSAIVRKYGENRLFAVHWEGDGRSPADYLGHPPADFGARACLQKAESGGWYTDVGVPWAEYMEAWSAKVWREDKSPAPALGTSEGAVHPLPSLRRYWPDNDVTAGRKVCLNPWAPFFGYPSVSALASSWVVQEYLCAAHRETTTLHVLFTEGLVGVARRLGDDEKGAVRLQSDLLGGGIATPKRNCGAARTMVGMDTFMTGSGGASLVASFVGGVPLAVVGTLASAAAAAGMASSVKC